MAAMKRGTASAEPTVISTACVITARVDGVWCVGQRHGATETHYPDGWFSARQIEELRAHPDLDVAGALAP